MHRVSTPRPAPRLWPVLGATRHHPSAAFDGSRAKSRRLPPMELKTTTNREMRPFYEAGLFVEDALGGNGAAVLVAGDGDLHFEDLVGDHPGEQFKGLYFGLVAGPQRVCQKVGFDLAEALGTLGDGVNFGLVEGAADKQAHSA